MSFQELIQPLLAKADAISSHPALLAALLGSSIALVFWAFSGPKKDEKLPPGPSPLPILGNLHQFGTLPHRSLHELSKKYGPLMFLRLGSFPAVIVSSSKMAKEFLKTHDLAFANRPNLAASELIAYNSKNIGCAPFGTYWKNMKKIWEMELLSPKRLEGFRSIREEEASLGMRSIWEKSKGGKVKVNVNQSIYSVTSGVLWRMLAGRKYSDEDVGGGGAEVTEMCHELMSTMGNFNIGDFIPSIDWMDVQGLKRRMRRAHKFFDKVVEKIIDEHVERNKQHGKKSKQDMDIVDVLLDLMENQTMEMEIKRVNIKAIVLDILIAGMENTATTLEWTMSALVKNPRVAKKLQEEIQSVVGKNRLVKESDLEGMEYLNCVMKESLRLYIPGPLLLPHESTEECIIGPEGYVLPAKTKLFINAWAIARDPAVWEDPLEFKPERFLKRRIDILNGQEFDMLPFGAGRRSCPASQMAMTMMTLVLAQLMHCFDWRIEGNPADLDMTEVFGVTIPRKHSLFAYPSLKLSVSLLT